MARAFQALSHGSADRGGTREGPMMNLKASHSLLVRAILLSVVLILATTA